MFNKNILLGLSLAFLSSHTLASNFVINELIYNAGGESDFGGSGDAGREWLEIKGAPNASLNGVTFLYVDGDHSATVGGKGTIDMYIDLSGFSTGSNGLFLLSDLNSDGITHIQSMDPATNTYAVDFFNNGDGSNTEIENGTNTFMLVDNYTGGSEYDIDPNDDDSSWDPSQHSLPWDSVIDAISIEEQSGTSEADKYAEALGFTSFSKAGDDLGKDPDGFIRIGSNGASSIVTVSHANDAAGASGQAIIGLALDNETFRGATLSDRTLTNQYDGLRFTPGATNVPVPAAAWLLGSALISLAGIRRIRK